MALCSGHSFFYSMTQSYFVWHMSVSPWYPMVRCVAYFHELSMTLTFYLNIKIIFSPCIRVWRNVFALWHRYTKFWHMGVSPWDNMSSFLTLVGPWPLTYIWVAGVSLVSFTKNFYHVLTIMEITLFLHFKINSSRLL